MKSKKPTTPCIHLIERNKRIAYITEGSSEFESGYWYRIGKNNADALIGGTIYFHKKQSEPSYAGGKITGWRIEEDGEFAGKYVFRFQVDDSENYSGVYAAGPWTGGGVRCVTLDNIG